MRKVFLICCIVAVTVFARENPFKSPSQANISEASMENINKIEKLQSLTITPPVESVKIKKVTIEYQSIDGVKIKKTYDIEKGIDPLKTIKVSQ